MSKRTSNTMPSIENYPSLTSRDAFLVDWPAFYPVAYARSQNFRERTRHDAGVRYGSDEHQVMNIFYPEKQTAKPVVYVHMHGGAFLEGHPDFVDYLGERLIPEGITFVSMGYRIAPTRFPDSAVDVAHGLAKLDAHLHAQGISGARYCLSGHSAGASIAALLGVRPDIAEHAGVRGDAIDAMVLISGIYDFTPPDPAHVFVEESRRPESSPVLHGEHAPRATLLVYGEPEINLKANAPDIFKVRAAVLEGALRSHGHRAVRIGIPGADHVLTASAIDDDRVLTAVIELLQQD
jgi:acetyl esterase/lipase